MYCIATFFAFSYALVNSKDILDVVKPVFMDNDVPADLKGKLMELSREVILASI